MATATTNTSPSILAQRQEMGVDNAFPVESRISWGAILAGELNASQVKRLLEELELVEHARTSS